METNIDFPEGLPAPLWGANQNSVVSPNERSTMASGRARQRQVFDSVPQMRSATWIFTPAQARAFELFYKVTLKNGNLWFNIPLRTPVGFTSLVCRIVDVYTGPNNFGAHHWQMAATLEIWERPTMPDEWAILPSFVANPEIFDLAMNREWPAVYVADAEGFGTAYGVSYGN